MTWIKCSERLPEPYISVLGWAKECSNLQEHEWGFRIVRLTLDYGDSEWRNVANNWPHDVTLWADLPEEPKEEE